MCAKHRNCSLSNSFEIFISKFSRAVFFNVTNIRYILINRFSHHCLCTNVYKKDLIAGIDLSIDII